MMAVGDGDAALAAIESHAFDVAIVDLNLPGVPGERLVGEFRERSPSTEVVVLTAHATVERAVRTLKDGAYDFLTKPCNLDELETVLRKAHEKHLLVRENRVLQRELRRAAEAVGVSGHQCGHLVVVPPREVGRHVGFDVVQVGERIG